MNKLSSLPLSPFWKTNLKGKVTIVKSELRNFIQRQLGYYKFNTGNGYELVRLRNGIVHFINEDELPSEIYSYLEFYNLSDVEEAFLSMSSSLKAIKDSLDSLPDTFNKDKKGKSYFYFKNGIVRVDKGQIQLQPYSKFNGCIWNQQLISRDFKNTTKECVFEKFLLNVSGNDINRFKSLKTIIGYLLHGYKDPANAKAIILLDKNIDLSGKANGGTGKSIIAKAIAQLTNLLQVSGRRMDTSSSFVFQQLKPYTKVFYIDDVSQKFTFSDMYTAVTSDMTVEQKYKEASTLLFKDSPKILISSNYILGNGGISDKRRMVEFELSDYYNISHTPENDFNHRFFDDWDNEEWSRFDNFMISCCQLFLSSGIIKPTSLRLKENRLTTQTSPEFFEFAEVTFKVGEKYNKRNLYNNFIATNTSFRSLSKINFKQWIDCWGEAKNLFVKHTKSNGIAVVSFLDNSKIAS